MDSTKLTPKQREALKTIIWKHTRFLNRLIERMNRLEFPKDDPMYLAALKALEGQQQLHDSLEEIPAWRRAMGR